MTFRTFQSPTQFTDVVPILCLHTDAEKYEALLCYLYLFHFCRHNLDLEKCIKVRTIFPHKMRRRYNGYKHIILFAVLLSCNRYYLANLDEIVAISCLKWKVAALKGDTLPKLDIGDEQNTWSVICVSVPTGLRAAIIRTFILACANFSFVRPAPRASGRSTVFDREPSLGRFIKLTRLIGRVHYSVDPGCASSISKKHDPMRTVCAIPCWIRMT